MLGEWCSAALSQTPVPYRPAPGKQVLSRRLQRAWAMRLRHWHVPLHSGLDGQCLQRAPRSRLPAHARDKGGGGALRTQAWLLRRCGAPERAPAACKHTITGSVCPALPCCPRRRTAQARLQNSALCVVQASATGASASASAITAHTAAWRTCVACPSPRSRATLAAR